jgi:hypothetical protein
MSIGGLSGMAFAEIGLSLLHRGMEAAAAAVALAIYRSISP